MGTLEKFRPYGPPTEEWLKTVRTALQTQAAVTEQ
jgi:hypothetical protein